MPKPSDWIDLMFAGLQQEADVTRAMTELGAAGLAVYRGAIGAGGSEREAVLVTLATVAGMMTSNRPSSDGPKTGD